MNAQRILIVDDDADFGDFVLDVFEEMGCTARLLTVSNDFKPAFEEFGPDVIILDLNMPGFDGLELVHWLSRQGCTARIVIVSGLDRLYLDATREIGETRGLDKISFLQKPVSPQDLRSVVAQL